MLTLVVALVGGIIAVSAATPRADAGVMSADAIPAALLALQTEATSELEAALAAAADATAEVQAEAEAAADEEADADEEVDLDLETDADADTDAESESLLEAEADAEADAEAEGDNNIKGQDKSFCPSGYKIATDPGTKVVFDGCGSEVTGASLHSMLAHLPQSVHVCCNKHDVGYDTCGRSRKSVDDDFKKCLAAAVAKEAAMYKILPTTMYQAVRLGGKDPYIVAQKRRCQCEPTEPMVRSGAAPSGAPAIMRAQINTKVPFGKA